MKQYCRYCRYLFVGNGIWCDFKEKTIAESTAKTTNKCKYFQLNKVDSFFENTKGYIPRKEKVTELENQINFMEEQ